jgi:hypothetical protein
VVPVSSLLSAVSGCSRVKDQGLWKPSPSRSCTVCWGLRSTTRGVPIMVTSQKGDMGLSSYNVASLARAMEDDYN